ncbi:MAG: histidinol-phosphate transaminase [Chloroflexota bacterium]
MEEKTVYKMSANENSIGPSAKAVAAMTKAVQSANRYPPYIDQGLREALAAYHGQGLTADHIYTGNSGCEVIEFIYRQMLSPGDNAIVCSPTFGIYFRYGKMFDIETRDVPLIQPDFTLDVDGILAAVNENTKLLVIINPNNPTGTLIGKEAYNALIEQLPKHVTLLADEVYYTFSEQDELADIIGHINAGKNVIRVHSFSKAFGMAGLRLGYGIASVERATALRGLQRAFHINAVSTEGAKAVLCDDQYINSGIKNARDGRAYLYGELDRLDVRYWPSQTNFVMIETKFQSADMAERLEAAGILVRNPKDQLIPNCVRVTVGLPEENQVFIERLEEILAAQS